MRLGFNLFPTWVILKTSLKGPLTQQLYTVFSFLSNLNPLHSMLLSRRFVVRLFLGK